MPVAVKTTIPDTLEVSSHSAPNGAECASLKELKDARSEKYCGSIQRTQQNPLKDPTKVSLEGALLGEKPLYALASSNAHPGGADYAMCAGFGGFSVGRRPDNWPEAPGVFNESGRMLMNAEGTEWLLNNLKLIPLVED